MTISVGSKLGPYEITSAIGAGGMGEVYLARDTRLDRDVAIKVLLESFAEDEERVRRFRREAKVLASLNHPHIAAIYDVETVDGAKDESTFYLVLEYIEGESLAERLKRGPLPVEEALNMGRH